MSTHTRQTLYGNVGATTDTYFLANGNVGCQSHSSAAMTRPI